MIGDMTLDRQTIKRTPNAIRQSLKADIDTWPVEVLLMTREFADFAKHYIQKKSSFPKAPSLETRKKGYSELEKYFGTVHYEKDYKEELYEALDEKYNRTH
jgi:hypothetical protein